MNSPFEKNTFNPVSRVNIAIGFVALVFFVLALRLWFLQVVRGEYFRNLSENNRMRTVYVAAPRGLVLDRNGYVLVKNRPAFNVELVKEDAPHPGQTLGVLADLIGIERHILDRRFRNQRKRRAFEPRLLLRDVERDTVARVYGRRYDLPGVVIAASPAREYVSGSGAAHVLGYLREISREQLKLERYAGNRPGDLVGHYGIENRYDHLLRGQRGKKQVEVNALGVLVKEVYSEPSRIGNTVQLTLDRDLQQASDFALQGKRGAIVALDPNSGHILALSSSPAFDPGVFVGEVQPAEWRSLVEDKYEPLRNRAIQSSYPPGSVFKMVTAAAALQEKLVDPHETVNCAGYTILGGRRFRCHRAAGHGAVALNMALARSCDVYFYKLAQRMGIDTIHKYATKFGLGVRTGIGLGEESSGLVPSTAWKKRHFKKREDQKWYPGETLSVVIGQGALLTTPLQIARALAALVNGGKLLRPTIVYRILDSEGEVVEEISPEVQGSLGISTRVVNAVRAGLVSVVNHPLGTGKRAQLEEFSVAGKTGTAQVVSARLADANKDYERYKDHAWFMAYAPADAPKIVLAILVEHSGHGGVVAAPIAKQLLRKFFKIADSEPEIEQSLNTETQGMGDA